MKDIPETRSALVLRTDFSDDPAWDEICAAIQRPAGEFRAYVECVSDTAFDGVTLDQLTAAALAGPYRSFMFVVDETTLARSDHAILVVDLFTEPGRTFRVIPPEVWSVENNLSIANMDFAEFANSTGEDGVFRGFAES